MNLDQLIGAGEELCEVLPTDGEHLMETIVTHLELTPDHLTGAATCWEDENRVYQLFYLDQEGMEQREKQEGDVEVPQRPLNQLASLLTGREVGIYGPAILFRAGINDDNHGLNESARVEDVLEILKLRTVHTGVRVPVNGEMSEFTYTHSPLESVEEGKRENYSSVEIQLFGIHLFAFFQLEPEEDQVNRRLTRLHGERRIHGEVLLVNRLSQHNYGELSLNLVKKLLQITYGPLKKRELEGEELEHRKKGESGIPKILNPLRVVHLRKPSVSCNYCGKENELTVCTGCYRLRYRSRECQQSDWRTHKEDCIKLKKSLNSSTVLKLEKEKYLQNQQEATAPSS